MITSFSALLIIAGCSTLPPADLRAPELALADLSLTDIGFDRIRFRAVLDTANPNDVVVPLTAIRVDLTVLGVALAHGHVPDHRIDLPARGRASVPVDFTVPTGRLLDLFERVRERGWENIDYRLAGNARWADTPFDVPFERSGNLDVLKRLAVLLGSR